MGSLVNDSTAGIGAETPCTLGRGVGPLLLWEPLWAGRRRAPAGRGPEALAEG